MSFWFHLTDRFECRWCDEIVGDVSCNFGIISEVPKDVVASRTKQTANVTSLVIMIYSQALRASSSTPTNTATASLSLVKGIILLSRDAVGLVYPAVVCELLRRLPGVAVMGCTAWSRMRSGSFGPAHTILTRLNSG